MTTSRFREQFQDYNRWKDNLVAGMQTLQRWLSRNELASSDSDRAIRDCLELLHSDQLTVAFVAEFSRGKSELINAIFFAEYGRRILPSAAGRTTMCPTELFYDRVQDKAYIRLLPIETRGDERSIADFKKDPSAWTNIDLDLDSAEQIQRALQEVVQVKPAKIEEAKRLGLYNPGQSYGENDNDLAPGYVEIPRWRHAIISFPHPLLKQGLTLLDTPGLNALGTEPELTLNMLPKAQAVVFVLGADTGVTRSDLEIWQHHIKGFCSNCNNGLVVVLNKIDTMWDELKEPDSVHASIQSQGRTAAAILGVDESCVFPVSAHKGLVAKIRKDNNLLSSSRLLELEAFLSNHVMSMRRKIIADNIQESLDHLLAGTDRLLNARHSESRRHLDEVRSLTGEQKGQLLHLMKQTREEQTTYLKNVESFHASRRVVAQQVKLMMEVLEIERIDGMIEEARNEMLESWTTVGLKATMKSLFERFHTMMRDIQVQNEQTRRLVVAVYRKFQEEHGIGAGTPRLLRVMKYSVELEKLSQEADAFRRSPSATFTGQSYLVTRFFSSIVSRARDIFHRSQQDAESWTQEIMTPLVKEIREHKQRMEGRLSNLKQISQSKQGLEGKLQELERSYREMSALKEGFDAIRARLADEFADLPARDEQAVQQVAS